jgi:hypothetical protein
MAVEVVVEVGEKETSTHVAAACRLNSMRPIFRSSSSDCERLNYYPSVCPEGLLDDLTENSCL